MNAPANIQPEALYTPEERAHRAAISIHCPNDGKMELRVKVAELRDRAGAAMSRCCDEAYPYLLQISRQASVVVYAPISAKRMMFTIIALNAAIDAANAMERASRMD